MGTERGLVKHYIYKPCTRWAYKRGKVFTTYYIGYYFRKYLIKYIRKRGKMSVGFRIHEYAVDALSKAALDALDKKTVETEEDLIGVLFNTWKACEIEHMEQKTKTHSSYCFKRIYYQERKQLMVPNITDSDDEASDSDDEDLESGKKNDTLEEALRDIALYATGLYKKAASNKGLDHGKTKEYWLERGPRQFITMILYAAFSFFINESLGAPEPNERLKAIIVAGVAMFIAGFMLYYRLPDSINSAILRSCHDWYVMNKKKKLPKLLKSKTLDDIHSELEGAI